MSLTQPTWWFVGFKKNGSNGSSDESWTRNVYSRYHFF